MLRKTDWEYDDLSEEDGPWGEEDYWEEDGYGNDNYSPPAEKRVFRIRICTKCGKQFSSSNKSELCMSCTLDKICNGNPPEEGDFNTAGILSGTISNEALGELHDYI